MGVDTKSNTSEHTGIAEELLQQHISGITGRFAVGLSHANRLPNAEVQDGYRTAYVLDSSMSGVITNPGEIGQEFSSEAIEAARRGDEEVARLLETSSGVMDQVSSKLVAEGFGDADKLETEYAMMGREYYERSFIFDAAYEVAIQSAVNGKKNGDTEAAVNLMAALMLIRQNDDYRISLRPFRQAVIANLGDELREAAQRMAKVGVLHASSRGTSSFRPIVPHTESLKLLLSLATGKELNDDWSEKGNLDMDADFISDWEMTARSFADYGPDADIELESEDFANFLAVAQSWPLDVVKSRLGRYLEHEYADGRGMTNTLLDYLDSVVTSDEHDPVSDIYKICEKILGGRDARYVLRADNLKDSLRFENPERACELTQSLQVDVSDLVRMFVHKGPETDEQPIVLDDHRLKIFMQIREQMPEIFEKLTHKSKEYFFKLDPHNIIEGARVLEQLGLRKTPLKRALLETGGGQAFLEDCRRFVIYAKGHYLDPADAAGVIIDWHVEIDFGETLHLTERFEIFDSFRESFARLELGDCPETEKSLKHLGIPDDIASDMFASWATFDAYSKKFYSNGKWNYPEGTIDDRVRDSIGRKQADTIVRQLQAVGNMVQQYGLEDTLDMIRIFGIYNFSRYQPDELKVQLDDWRNGIPVQNVIVKARSDWNSAVSSHADGESDLTHLVYFEAGSASAVARIAVKIGRHAREHGYKPEINNFIIHAHGSPSGMIMGVDEMLDVELYGDPDPILRRARANSYRRHLGENFRVILWACSTAGRMEGNQSYENIAHAISERHDVQVIAKDVPILMLTLYPDGRVEFPLSVSDEQARLPVVYGAVDADNAMTRSDAI